MKIPIQRQFHRPEISKPFLSEIKDIPIDDASNSIATRDGALYAVGRKNRHRVVGNWVTRVRQTGPVPLIRDFAKNMLTSPAPGEVPQFKEDAWLTISDLDARRQNKENCATILGAETFESVRNIAANPDHPRHADAKLLSDIMNRPLGEDRPSLESYVSGLVSLQVKNTMGQDFDTSPSCDFHEANDIILFTRTFTGIMQSVTLNSQDYTSIGRSLILKGAAHLLRIPRKLDTCSAANWTPVPDQTGHLFQAKLDTLGATARG